MLLEEMIAELGSAGSRGDLVLDAGRHGLTEPLIVGRSGVTIRGVRQDGAPATEISRGRLADGEPYAGPLLVIEGRDNIRILDLEIDGGRFDATASGAPIDHRHPLDADSASARFPSAKILPAPECFAPESFVSDGSPDVVLASSTRVTLERVRVRNSIRIGLAIGRGCSDIALKRVEVSRAGEYGVWIGFGFPAQQPLPVAPELVAMMPSRIVAEQCFFDRCGGSALYLEANAVTVSDSLFTRNHCDFPFNDEGAQIAVDYRASHVKFERCGVLAGPCVERPIHARAADQGAPDKVLLGAIGFEVSGDHVTFEDIVVEGNAREAIQLVGARDVAVIGARTRLINNNIAQLIHPLYPCNPGRQNISVTTTAWSKALNAVSRDIRIEDICCENGVAVWSNGSVADLRIDGLRVRGADLSGPAHSGVYVGTNPDGRGLRGKDWEI